MKSTEGRPSNPQLSLLMQPLGLTEGEIQDLITFLQALTGDV